MLTGVCLPVAADLPMVHNSVMQFYTPGDAGISFLPKIKWQEGLNAPVQDRCNI